MICLKFILASASERRKDLLSRIVSNFEVKISNFDEEKVEVSTNIENYVKTLAEGKAKDVALNCDNDSDRKSTRLNSSHNNQSRMPSSA